MIVKIKKFLRFKFEFTSMQHLAYFIAIVLQLHRPKRKMRQKNVKRFYPVM